MTNAETQKSNMIADFINDQLALIADLATIPDEGSVQIIGDLFVNETSFMSGLKFATVYTKAQLEACAEHGIGVPSYTNGNGDRSKLISMKDAKEVSVMYAKRAIDLMKSL
jgi:hypothetical protein